MALSLSEHYSLKPHDKRQSTLSLLPDVASDARSPGGLRFPYLCTDSVEAAVAWLQARGILRGGVVLIG
jgi:hypothetical protein